jgi:hypothetical protein
LRFVAIAIASTTFLAGCSKQEPYNGAIAPVPGCEGVNALVAQEISTQYDVESGRKLAANLAVAAEADVANLKAFKDLGAKVNGESQLGTTLRGTVTTKSNVTTEFFQQDQSFAQSVCWLQSVLAEKNLSSPNREYYEDQRKKIAANRVTYLDLLTGIKKN